MKKIININLSGRVIPIEDAAYESLQRYIESLRRYFAHEEGRDEIINDIESRIAELMNDKIRKGAHAITEADMEEIITSMGRVEDFEAADATEANSASNYSEEFAQADTSNPRFKGRLYRDATDKILGGVCAGIANYMNVDPAIVRLLFAIITFGGFGMGFLLYILLWIILPASNVSTYQGKRLFRNRDDRMLGGVAGGLAAYFNKSSTVVRVIFAAPLLLNIFFGIFNGPFGWNPIPNVFFGSLTGTFIMVYIILWIVLPEARSPFEKMEMRGEKVDVNRIRQNVQEGMTDIKGRAQTFGQEVKASAQNLTERAKTFAGTRGKAFATEVSETARPVANGIGHIIGVLFKAFFLFIAGTIAFALFVIVLVFIVSGASEPFNSFLLEGFWQKVSFWGTLVFFLAVPLIAIITWIVRRAMKVKSQNRYLGWVFAGLWLLGFVSLSIFASSMVRSFRRYDKVEQNVDVQAGINKITLRVDEPVILYSDSFDWINSDGEGFDITKDSLFMSNVKLRVSKSDDTMYHVTMIKYGAGRNRSEARARAEKIRYHVNSVDSTLLLGSGFAVGKTEKFRGQKIIVEIKVPVGKKILFHSSVEDKLHPMNVRIAAHRRWNRDTDWDRDWDEDSYFEWKSNVEYVMTESEKLEEANSASTKPANGVYEYKTGTKDSLRKQIEEKERQIEKDKQLLEEAENKQTTGMEQKAKKKTETVQTQLPAFSFFI